MASNPPAERTSSGGASSQSSSRGLGCEEEPVKRLAFVAMLCCKRGRAEPRDARSVSFEYTGCYRRHAPRSVVKMHPSFWVVCAPRSAPSVRERIPVPAPGWTSAWDAVLMRACLPSSMILRVSGENRAPRACVILEDSSAFNGADASSTSQELNPTPLSHTFYPVAYKMSKPGGCVVRGHTLSKSKDVCSRIVRKPSLSGCRGTR